MQAEIVEVASVGIKTTEGDATDLGRARQKTKNDLVDLT
jgi:hypothetical protein